ncbi:MAG: hypothetical protein NT169_25795 [Chloroflexi bacterium]|nr:hypothetical protein [Chloroflexota bacterium]
MIKILFNETARESAQARNSVSAFLERVETLEAKHDMPVIIFQDGASCAYYIKCSLLASDAARLCDLDAKLDITSPESYRANRVLFLTHFTYQRMASDAAKGREFNDIIVEYNTEYSSGNPLKVWGGQHRIRAISTAYTKTNRYHGFRIYFNLNKDQRTEVALISNTNIAVSNDTFDRIIEETLFGGVLRKWCQKVGFLGDEEDFPDVGSRSEKITVKKARSFVVNFYLGYKRGQELNTAELDHNVYEPYLAETGIKAGTGITVDRTYSEIMKEYDILNDSALLLAGQRFLALHNAQYKAVVDSKTLIKNITGYRNKALIESVLCGWSYVAGLLQSHPERLSNHYRIPKTSGKIPDPLNAKDMSKYKHDKDDPTYRGLGTRSATKDRQRIAQLFLAKSLEENVAIDEKFMDKAVSQVIGLLSLSQGYA